MTYDEFINFRDTTLQHLDDTNKDEQWGTQREIMSSLFDSAEQSAYGEHLAREERRAHYLKLKEEFEKE